ncbi:hypothetical protein D3C75_924140 [compost metagenome]
MAAAPAVFRDPSRHIAGRAEERIIRLNKRLCRPLIPGKRSHLAEAEVFTGFCPGPPRFLQQPQAGNVLKQPVAAAAAAFIREAIFIA